MVMAANDADSKTTIWGLKRGMLESQGPLVLKPMQPKRLIAARTMKNSEHGL